MATKKQAWELYQRFFPKARFAHIVAKAEWAETNNRDDGLPKGHETSIGDKNHSRLSELASQFAEVVPEDEFSTAELQGYLLTYKMKPLDAVSGIAQWIEHERMEKRERDEREKQRKEKLRESRLRAKTAMVADLVGPSPTPQDCGARRGWSRTVYPSYSATRYQQRPCHPVCRASCAAGYWRSRPIQSLTLDSQRFTTSCCPLNRYVVERWSYLMCQVSRENLTHSHTIIATDTGETFESDKNLRLKFHCCW